MCADLCHQEHLVTTPVPQRPAQDGLGLAVVVFPSVVEESNASINRLVDKLDRLVQGCHIAEVMAADPDSRNLRTCASKLAINHFSHSRRWPCGLSLGPSEGGRGLLRGTRDTGCRSYYTRAGFQECPSSRIHLCSSDSIPTED